MEGRRPKPTLSPMMLPTTADVATPLAGIRVLDLSRLLPGPYCLLLLACKGVVAGAQSDARASRAARLGAMLARRSQPEAHRTA